MRDFFGRFCIAAFAALLAAFVPVGEADLPTEHAYWQSLEAGECAGAAYTLTTHSLDARRGLRALRYWEEESWTKGVRPLHFPGLEFCLARRHLENGIETYRSSGLSFPIFENAQQIEARKREDADEESGVDEIYKGLFRFAALSDLYYGPAIAEWARRASDGLLIPPDFSEAYQNAFLADYLGTPVEVSLMAMLLANIDVADQKRIEQDASEEIDGLARARAEAVGFNEDWIAGLQEKVGGSRRVIVGYSEALSAGACDVAVQLLMAARTSEYADPRRPWDWLSPSSDVDLFQCRAEAVLARGEVLAAGADLTILADLLYDPALLTLAEIYRSGEYLPADPARAYRYLVLAEGFGAADPVLRQSLVDVLSENDRANIDIEITQGWPDLFRNLKETGKAGLFVGSQPGLTSGD